MLIQLIILLVIVGLLLWIVSQIPMDPTIAKIIRVVVIVCVVLYLLQLFAGAFSGINILAPPRR